jgi:hypothetical protein
MTFSARPFAAALGAATIAFVLSAPAAEAQWGYGYGYGRPYAYGPGPGYYRGYYRHPYVYAPGYAYAPPVVVGPPVVVVRPPYATYHPYVWRGRRPDTGLRSGVTQVSPHYDRY